VTVAEQDDSPQLIKLALDVVKNPRVHEHRDKRAVNMLLQQLGCRLGGGVWSNMDLRTQGFQYACMEHWVLEHGYYYAWAPLSQHQRDEYDLEMGEIKQCYHNAYEAACSNSEIAVYVQGYAVTLLHFQHAWVTLNTEPEGNIAELTLRVENRPDGFPIADYFGVPFDLEWVEEVYRTKEEYNVIDHWQANYPLLKDDSLLDRALHPDWSGR